MLAAAGANTGGGGGGASYYDEVMADSPTGFWRLDETSGSTATDEAGTHPGAYGGTYTLNASPLVTDGGRALSIAGAGRMRVPHHADFNMDDSGVSDTTIEAWVKFTDPDADDIGIIGDKTGASASNGQWGLWYDNRSSQGSPKKIHFMCRHADIQWAGTATRDAVGAGGHLVAVKRGSVLELWWDGTLMESNDFTSFGAVDNSLDPTFGQSTSGTLGVNGTLDNIAFYRSALSSTRIAAHYAAGL